MPTSSHGHVADVSRVEPPTSPGAAATEGRQPFRKTHALTLVQSSSQTPFLRRRVWHPVAQVQRRAHPPPAASAQVRKRGFAQRLVCCATAPPMMAGTVLLCPTTSTTRTRGSPPHHLLHMHGHAALARRAITGRHPCWLASGAAVCWVRRYDVTMIVDTPLPVAAAGPRPAPGPVPLATSQDASISRSDFSACRTTTTCVGWAHRPGQPAQ